MLDTDHTAKRITETERLLNKGIWVTAGTILLIMLMMTTCTMHSNTYDGERIREEAAAQKNEIELAKQKAIVRQAEIQADKERLEIIERLIKSGINPVAARCGINGWTVVHDDPTCLVAAGINNNSQRKTEE